MTSSITFRILTLAIALCSCSAGHPPIDEELDAAAPPDAAAAADAAVGRDAGDVVVSCAPNEALRTDAWMTCPSAAPFYWNGTACLWIGDCACSGASCGSGWPTFDVCMEAHATCLDTHACNSSRDCAADTYCHIDGAVVCGAAGKCWPRPAVPLDCGFAADPTCGCTDHGAYGNRCRAHLNGQDGASACAP